MRGTPEEWAEVGYRVRRYVLPWRELLSVLRRREVPDAITWHEPLGIPEDARVHYVYHDQPWMGLAVLVSHSSFEEVPDGEQIPDGGPLHLLHRAIPVVKGVGIVLDTLDLEQLRFLREAVSERIYDLERSKG